MALRRRIAERISRLKQRTAVETPILEELPLTAKSLGKFELPFPEVRGILPVLARGEAYGETAGRWYRVSFPHPIVEPKVVAVAEGRKGRLPAIRRLPSIPDLEDLATIPELPPILKERIPDLTIPRWSIHIPTADDFVDLVKDFFGDWGLFNWMRDAIAWAIGNWEYWIWDKMFRPRGLEKMNEILVKLQNRINDRLTRIRNTLNTKLGEIDDRVETIRSRINRRLGDVDDRFETVRTKTNDALKVVFPRLYEAWGQRTDMAVTIANIRNVTSNGFEFLSMGETTIHWVAVGRRR